MVSPKSSSEELPGIHFHSSKERRNTYNFNKYAYIFCALFLFTSLYFLNTKLGLPIGLGGSGQRHNLNRSLLSWINEEEALAYDQIYMNIGGGSRAKDAAPGAVIASPSTYEPDYYYQWVRDSAITFKTIIGQYIEGDNSLKAIVNDWAFSQDAIQRTENPSGKYTTGGIGEPKFMPDNSPYMGSWGRPQDDGPAIRATVLMAYVDHFLAQGGSASELKFLYDSTMPVNSVIKADLEYISHNWQNESFDLWEEVKGQHFFTLIVQLRAVLEGAAFARRMSDPGAAVWYDKQAVAMRHKLDEFWSQDGWIISTLLRDPAKPRGGLDCGTILGSIHGMSEEQTAYNPHSDRMLATHFQYVQAMKSLYKINKMPDIPGVAVGRYPEDVYDGYHKSLGNPWYLCTTAAAELMYTATHLFERERNISVSTTSLQFFQQFLPSASSGQVFGAGSKEFRTIIDGMTDHGDSFMATVRHFAQANGSLSEQYNRDTGAFQGARDLTWSYGAFISASQARRNGIVF